MSPIPLAARLLLAALLLPLAARAADVTWTGAGASDAWSDPANWSPGVPGAADHAIVPAGTPRSPRLTAPASAGRLTVAAGATLDARGGALTLGAGPHDIAGTLAVGAPSWSTDALVLNGPMTVRGRMDWHSGTVYAFSPASLTIAPEGLLVWTDDPTGRRATTSLDVQGTLRWLGGTTRLHDGAYSRVSSGLFEIALSAPAALEAFSVGAVGQVGWTSAGTLRVSSGEASFDRVRLTVGGDVDVRAGRLRLNASTRWENATVAVADGAELSLSQAQSDFRHEVAGTLAGAPLGTLALDDHAALAADPAGGALDIAGTGLLVRNGRLGTDFTPVADAPVNRGLVRLAGDVTVARPFVNEGTLRWESGTPRLGAFQLLTNTGLLDIRPAADASWLPYPFANGRILNTGIVRKSGPATATLENLLETVGARVEVADGALVLGYRSRWDDATVDVSAGASLRLENRGCENPHVIAGTLRGSPQGSVIVSSSGGSGLVTDPVRGGVLAVEGTGLQLGFATLGSPGGSCVAGGVPENLGLLRALFEVRVAGQDLRNAGTLRWEAGLLVLDAGRALVNAGRMEIDGGAEMRGQPFATPARLVNGGTLRMLGAGTTRLLVTVVNHGTLAADAGTLALVPGGDGSTRFVNEDPGVVSGTGTLDVSALPVAQVLNTGVVAPGAPGAPGTLTWRGLFPMDPQARVLLDVGPGPAGARLAVDGTAALSGQLVVRAVGGYAPALGDAFDGVTAGAFTGRFASVATVTTGHIVFAADDTDPGRVRLVAVEGTPAPAFVVSPAPLAAGGIRRATLLGDGLDAAATVSLECRDCADPVGSGTLRGAVLGAVPGGLAVAFDLTAVGDHGDYDVVLAGADGVRRVPVEVEPFLALPVLLPTGGQGVLVRPAPQGLSSTQSLYNATNAPEPTVLMVRAEIDGPVRYDALGVALADGETATRTFFVPVGASLRDPASVAYRSGIAPEDVRFPGQPPLPDDPRVPLFASVPARFEVVGGLSRFQFTDALSRLLSDAAAATGQPVTPAFAWDAAAAAVDSLFGGPADARRRTSIGRRVSEIGVIEWAVAQFTNPITMFEVLQTQLYLQVRRGQGNGCRPTSVTGGGATCTGPPPAPPVPVCPASGPEIERRRRAIQRLIDRALADPSARNAELVIRLQEKLDRLPPAPFGDDADCNEDRPVVPQPTVAAFDPNDKLTPAPFGVEVVGTGTEATAGRTLIPLARAADAVTYTVRFENVPEATAPAGTVTVTDVLDDRFDPATLEFLGSTADSVLTISTAGQTVTFTFDGIELPPNRTPPEGEGALSFRVRPRQAFPDGTEFRNAASIVFDANPPIVTPEVVHVVRATAALSVSLSAPPSAEAGQPLVYTATVANAAGADAAADATLVLPAVAGAVLQSVETTAGSCSGSTTVVCDLGALAADDAVTVTVTVTPSTAGTLVLAAETTTATFDGTWHDDAVATEVDVFPVDAEPPPGLPTTLTLEAPYPNPTGGRASVRLGLPAAADATITVFDLLGRTIAEARAPDTAAGWHVLPLPTDALASGVYVLRLVAGEQVRTQRLTVVR